MPRRFPGNSTRMTRASLFKAIRVLVLFFAVLTLITFYISRHDPTSIFYQPTQTPMWDYTDIRREEATSIIQEATNIAAANTSAARIPKVDPLLTPDLCVGIASVARPSDARYFASAVGSLLHNLAPSERARIHLILFVAHIDQRKHPEWKKGWIPLLADTVLTYDTLPRAQLDHVQEMESAAGIYKSKGIWDYTYLLQACAATGANYTLMVEDDAIAIDGWFHRSMAAVAEAARRGKPYLYIRLFFTDTFMGWNGEDWPSYLFHSIKVFAIALVALSLLHFITFRSEARSQRILHAYLAPRFMIVYLFLVLPGCILLFFAAGRLTVLPPSSPTGLIEMHNYGCCSQGLLYPSVRLPEVISWLSHRDLGYVDVSLEEEANARGEVRYAMTPSVLQHAGTQSSKSSDMVIFNAVTNRIKSWTFENFDAEQLRREHERVLRKQALEANAK